jgi:molecular chaperone GrpE
VADRLIAASAHVRENTGGISMKKKKRIDMQEELRESQKENIQKEDIETPPFEGNEDTVSEQQPASEKKCPEERIRAYELELAEQKDKFLRLYAEFDNFRKRNMKERAEYIKSAETELVIALLPILDDLERAEKAFENATDIIALKEGVLLIQNKFRNILTQKGLQEINALGETFDTDIHEAIARVPASDEKENNIIKDQVEKGYYFNGKVVRYAKVVVAGS